ncbi:hypothetical protein A2U01_0053913, partial [Trifolium medium]|nr:hypothetical protein [Trifolium medium]
ANRGLFVPFACNFKKFKDGYFGVRHGVGADELMFDSNGGPLFPFYWTSQLVALKGTDALTKIEGKTELFDSFKTVVPFRDLQGMEGDSITIKSFLRKSNRS